MRGVGWLAIAFAVGAALAVPAAAGAQIPTQDSVTGSGFLSIGLAQGPCQLQVDARSGPSGENPTGTTLCTPLPGPPGSEVTCLNVQGNVALMTDQAARHRVRRDQSASRITARAYST